MSKYLKQLILITLCLFVGASSALAENLVVIKMKRFANTFPPCHSILLHRFTEKKRRGSKTDTGR